MRTTVTLESDVEALLKQRMRERGLSFKRALNEAVRAGLKQARAPVPPFKQRTVRMGRPKMDLTKALALAGELEDQQRVRRYHRS